MKEDKQRIEFLKDFLEDIENEAIRSGSTQGAFLEKMLKFMERPEEPEVLIPAYLNSSKKIELNAYAYDTESLTLDLYVVDYDFDQNSEEILTINKSEVTEVGTRAKRFITNIKSIQSTRDHSLQVYELAKIVSENQSDLEEVNIFIITNRYYLANKPVDIKIPGIENLNVEVWDIDRVQQLITSEQGIQNDHIDFEEDFNDTFDMMFVPETHSGEQSNFDCYIGYISAELLAKAYDLWGPKLVERNVRSFLQVRGGTNKGIRNTLKDPLQKNMFVAYNNGISTIARSGDIERIKEGINLYRIKGLTGWQIVNGGQTTASIHQAYKEEVDLSGVFVQAKLTILKVDKDTVTDKHSLEDEMVSRISEYANTQNKINKSDLLANTRFMSDLEKFSRSTWMPALKGRKPESKWYFERARGQYMVDINRRKRGKEQNDFKKLYPKDKVITKVEMAKYFMSWEGFPHVSSKGGEEAFKKFMEFNKNYWKSDVSTPENLSLPVYQKIIARTIINNRVQGIVEEMKLKGYKANVVYYTVAMLHHVYGEEIDLIKVWEEQSLSDKWEEVVRIIASKTLFFLRDSAGERNVTQWAKQEACWVQYKETSSKELTGLI